MKGKSPVIAVVGVMLGAAFFTIAEASIAPPPPPPLGWEEQVTEGFEPPIETTIVMTDFMPEEEMRKLMTGWGDGAVAVLKRLHESPAWVKYRGRIIAHLGVIDTPEVTQMQADRLKALVPKESLSREERTELQILCYQLRTGPLGGSREFIESLLSEATPRAQLSIVYSLGTRVTPETVSMLKDLQKILTDARAIETVRYTITSIEQRLRAREPMSVILEREAGKKGEDR